MRSLIELITSIVAWLRWKLHLKIKPEPGQQLKLNLGCGLAVCQGWVNIDGSLNAIIASLPKVMHKIAYPLSGSNRYYTFAQYEGLLSGNRFFQANLSYGIPAETGSVDYIYSSHFVEHLYRHEAERLVAECYRVLKPGGVMRVAVPDLDYALKLMHGGERHRALVNYFFVEDKKSSFARHKYMYDFPLLESLLQQPGFVEIIRRAYQEGNVPDVRELDNRPEESLYVETTKPKH